MNEREKNEEINNVKILIEADFKKYEKYKDDVENAKKCLKHIKCIVCLDTNRYLLIRDGNWSGIWYVEFNCAICCNGDRRENTRHEYWYKAKGLNNRQIPCPTIDSRNGYTYTFQLAEIYLKDYEKIDKLNEIKDAEFKKLIADSKAEIDYYQKNYYEALNKQKVLETEFNKKFQDLEAGYNKKKQDLEAVYLKKDEEQIRIRNNWTEDYNKKIQELKEKNEILEKEFAKKHQELEKRCLQKLESLEKEFAKKDEELIKMKNELQIEIDKTKQLNQPDFSAQETVGLTTKRASMNAKFDIQEFVGQITAIISSAAGNIISLPNVIGNISVRLNACAESGEHQNYKFEKIRNEKDELVYIRYDYVKINKSNSFKFNYLKLDYSSAKEYIYVHLMILKPLNQSAINKCEELMNEESDKIFEKVRSAEKDKK